VLDRDQLRDITLDDPGLMREIVSALIDDTSRQMELLQLAIREKDTEKCMRLAHYSKGACANVGANSAAAACTLIEQKASQGEFEACSSSLAGLAREVERLRVESEKL
jgi:HPt (histidine-containing phosphotransfer) domain-containing protein